MRMRIMAAVLFLLAVESAMLWYFVGGFEARASWRAVVPPIAPRNPVFAGARGLATVRIVTNDVAVEETPPETRSTRIGFPFQLSESVEDDCRRSRTFSCSYLHGFIDDLAAEWRNPVWAAEMEDRLERAITRGERRKYEIRALECRDTRCAVEVASAGVYARVSLVSDDRLDRELRWYGASTIAWEDGANTGIPVIVTVATWEKRTTPARIMDR
jgi:hypothetical protein